jgi:hypothetical protein
VEEILVRVGLWPWRPSPAYAGPDVRTIQLRDDCDPASFDAAVGPGTCVGGGDTLFQDFLDEVLSTGAAEKWRFNSSRTEADRAVKAENRGGETHSFTEVNHFGGGFIPVLNGGQEPLNECAARDGNGNTIPDGNGNLVPAAAAIATLVRRAATPGTSRVEGHPVPVLHPPVDAVDRHRQIARTRAARRVGPLAVLRSGRLARRGEGAALSVTRNVDHSSSSVAPSS